MKIIEVTYSAGPLGVGKYTEEIDDNVNNWNAMKKAVEKVFFMTEKCYHAHFHPVLIRKVECYSKRAWLNKENK